MHRLEGWYVRLRPEYRWPYPALDPDAWYAVRESRALEGIDAGIWLACEPYAVQVFPEHLEPGRHHAGVTMNGEGQDDETTTVEFRIARLRPAARERFPYLPRGAWLLASEVVAAVPRGVARRCTRRRLHRLPDEYFEFRSEVYSRA